MEKYTSIGFTKKCHGLKGELKVQVAEEYVEDFLKTPVVFLDIKGRHLPYFVEKVKIVNELLLKLEDVDSKEAAKAITSKEMFLQAKNILKPEERELEVEETEDTLAFGKYVGYVLVDMEVGEVGKIEEVIEFPQQEMAVVLYQKKEIFIPLHEDLMEKIEDSQQRIYVNLPEGILDL